MRPKTHLDKHFTNSYWWESRLRAKLFNRGQWKKRNDFAKVLIRNGFNVSEYDNCWRLHAIKQDIGREIIIDCDRGDGFHTSGVSTYQEEAEVLDDLIYEIYGYYNNGSKFPARDAHKWGWMAR